MSASEDEQAKVAPARPEEWERFEGFAKRLLRVPVQEVRDLEGDARKPKKTPACPTPSQN